MQYWVQNFGRENFDDSTCIRQISSDFSTVKVLRYTVTKTPTKSKLDPYGLLLPIYISRPKQPYINIMCYAKIYHNNFQYVKLYS